METRRTTNKEQHRITLAEPIIGHSNNIRFDFISNYQRDKERYVNEVDKNEGRFIVTDTSTGKKYSGTYELKYWDENCKLIMRFDDFEILSQGFLAQVSQKMLLDDFEDMVRYLKYEFPAFKKSPEMDIKST